MSNQARTGSILLFALALPLSAAAQSRPDATEVVKRFDELFRAQSSHAVLEMEIVTPQWQRTLKMEAWSEGTQKTFIRILEPRKERGVGTLRIGNEMWNYLPNANRVMRIPPSMMMSSWMGSDLNNDDLVKEFSFAEDYTFQYTEVDNPAQGRLYIKAVPKPDRPIVWGHVVLEVDAKSLLPITEKYYDESGALMRVMSFSDVKTFDGRAIPSVTELIPQNKKGNKTILRYLEAQFNIDIPPDTFSQRNLRTFRG